MNNIITCPLPEECPTPEKPLEVGNGAKMHLVNTHAHADIETWAEAEELLEGADLETADDPTADETPESTSDQSTESSRGVLFEGPDGRAPAPDGGSNGKVVELDCGHEEVDLSKGAAAEQIDEHGFTVQQCDECGRKFEIYP